jgi:hypothetical protein
MRTDELINTLVADHAAQPRTRPIGHGLVMAIIGGLAISAALFSITLGFRPDIVSALGTWRFDMKLADNLVLVIVTTWVVLRLSRPTTTPPSAMRALVVPAFLLLAAVMYELVTVPASGWLNRAMGMNGFMCLANIIFLSIFPLSAVVYALRQAAPMSPALAGAAAGLLAGALGATVFAMHCMDDSPLFVAIWYTLATGLMAMVGLLVGQYVLRW